MSACESFTSVCDGIGAAQEAWGPLGWRPVLLSEIEDFPRAVLEQRHGARDLALGRREGAVPLFGDFTAIRIRHLRRFGIELPSALVGGTPCQAFSAAGLRESLVDARGNLTLQYVRLANAIDAVRRRRGLKPLVIAWENVPGVLTVKDNAFGCFLAGLVGADTPLVPGRGQRWTDAGLVVGPQRAAAWVVKDAQYFGLAQRRRRVFVVASGREGFDPAAVLFEPDCLFRDSPPRREAGQEEVAGTLGASSGDWSRDNLGESIIPFDTTQLSHPENRSRPEPGDPAPTLAKDGHPPAIAFALRGRDGGAMPEIEGDGALAGTIRAADGGSSRDYLADVRTGVRRLMPVECERLQGFRDGYTAISWRGRPPEECPDGPRYKALGNSMAVPCMAWLGRRIAAEEARRLAEGFR